MNVITEKNITCDIETCDNKKNFDLLLRKKQTFFFENIFPTYSHKEKASYMWNNNIDENYILHMCVLIIGFSIAIFGGTISLTFGALSAINILLALLSFGSGIYLIFSPLTFSMKKITARKWLLKEKNRDYLRNEMFWDSVVDKETLKSFIECYGEEDLVNLMLRKQNLTYKDISSYINEQENTELQEEKIRLSKAVKCLAQ